LSELDQAFKKPFSNSENELKRIIGQ